MQQESSVPNFIILTSHGRTATSWISNALNHHPDFCCTHSGLSVKFAERFQHKFNYDQINAHARDGSHTKLTMDEYFDLHLTIADVKNYASIHNFQLTSLHQFMEPKPKHEYQIHNIIRHPITRLRSYIKIITLREAVRGAHWRHLFQTGQKQRQLVDWVTEHFEVDFNDFSNIAFVCAFVTILIEAEELKMNYPHHPMEKLVGDQAYFAEWINTISKGSSKVDQQYLDTIFSYNKLNQPFKDNISAEEIFSQLPVWQQRVWQKHNKDFNLNQAYKPFGYNLAPFN